MRSLVRMGRVGAAATLVAGCLAVPGGLHAEDPAPGPSADAPAAADRSVEERLEALEAVLGEGRRVEQLEERVDEVEAAHQAREGAIREIIGSSLAGLGSRINEYVDLGGVIEVLPGWEQDFLGGDEASIALETLELQFEVSVGRWARGSLVIFHDNGEELVFTTTEDDEFSIDRINLDTAFLTIGNTEEFWPYANFGRMVMPFGISTGDPVADVLNIVDPLTVEIFETKKDGILLGFEFPTPPPMPELVIEAPPPVRPLLVAPLVGGLAGLLGYAPPPRPPEPVYLALPAPRPAFRLGVYAYQGDSFDRRRSEGSWVPDAHLGATLGYQTRGTCGLSLSGETPDEERNWLHVLCPWTLELGVDFNRSIFESDFLSLQYRNFLGPAAPTDQVRGGLDSIGFVPGMAASLRASLGPVALVGEWNGAIDTAHFQDDTRRRVDIKPSAWQISAAYQFDFKPWIEAIGAQGSYLTVSYSESRDLQGVQRFNANDFTLSRVGFAPKRRVAVGVGEWVLPNLRLALEYARAWDYSEGRGGTGRDADGIFSMITFEW